MKYNKKEFEKMIDRTDKGGDVSDIIARYEHVESSINQKPWGAALLCRGLTALENGWLSVHPVTKDYQTWKNLREAMIRGNRHLLDIAEKDLEMQLKQIEKEQQELKQKRGTPPPGIGD